MAETSLEERLRDYGTAFDGLLSLIPADIYYGKDTSDQWKKKKQTKEQAAAARRAKLDPDASKTAKDVMDERARKRKLEELQDGDGSDIEGVQKELPMEGLKQPQNKKSKKQKVSNGTDSARLSTTEDTPRKQKLSKSEKKLLKKEKKGGVGEKQKSERIPKGQRASGKDKADEKSEAHGDDLADVSSEEQEDEMVDVTSEEQEELPNGEIGHFEAEGLEEENTDEKNILTSPSPSPTFDNPTEPSANTSTSSVIPPGTAPKHIKLPTDPELLRSRLAARIEVLRAARKADGPDGKPARNRQELLEARRRKEEQRRAHKKELRLKAKVEAEAKAEAALVISRNSPRMSPMIHTPEQNFSFGRVAFADGQTLTDDLSSLREAPKKRGPRDVATALAASEKKCQRIANLDDEKRADIEEKDLWLNAKKRAHGEKVRDDTSLLKKTLKRKEKMKKKSEKEWTERKEGVAKSQAMKQKKREENLKKRRDEKGPKGKGKGKSVKSKKPKVKSRPGFEGSFGSGKRK